MKLNRQWYKDRDIKEREPNRHERGGKISLEAVFASRGIFPPRLCLCIRGALGFRFFSVARSAPKREGSSCPRGVR